MNTIEEKLWNYIDGNCPQAEHDAITRLIEQDEVYKKKYNELLLLNQEFTAMELDEPPMAFTYNVMEAIRTENALQPLKAGIDKRIIIGIAAFFALTILTLLVFVFSTVRFETPSFNIAVKLPAAIKLPDTGSIFNGRLFKWFLVFDVILGLFLADGYLRRKKSAKTV
ncbi:MAG TPA: hypothetical protein VIM77_07675 [Mucilaginibacter sp.]